MSGKIIPKIISENLVLKNFITAKIITF